jgi:hypothetical protein
MDNAPPSINLALMAWKLAQTRAMPWVNPSLDRPLTRGAVDDMTPASVEYYHILRRIEDGETP